MRGVVRNDPYATRTIIVGPVSAAMSETAFACCGCRRVKADYDSEAHAVYLLTTGAPDPRIARTICVSADLCVDDGAHGAVMGIETLGPDQPGLDDLLAHASAEHGFDVGAVTAALRAPVFAPYRQVTIEVGAPFG